MKTDQIANGKGVQLHVVETGNPAGEPILFIPGNSQGLTVHGALDAIVKASVVDQIRTRVPHAQVEMMANVGHAFWEDAAAFNQKLRMFVERCSSVSSRKPVIA